MLDNNRISRWFIGAALSWIGCFLLLFCPIFHLLLGVPISKIAISSAIGCGAQLAFIPWLFSARATPKNPHGDIGRRAVAVIAWITATAILFFYYLQRSWPHSSDDQLFRYCLFGTIVAAAAVALIVVNTVFHRRVE
jgi:hypothetical protein